MTSFEKHMAEGATILEHHPNQKDPTGRRFRTVKITLPSSDVKVFPNLRVEHLRPFVNPSELDEPMEDEQKQGGSTEGEDEEGKRSRSSLEPVGEEKTKEHAHDAKTPEPPKKKQKQHTNGDHVKDPSEKKKEKKGKPGSHGHGAGRSFEKLMEERTKIIDYHRTQTGNYTVHVRSPDGTIDVFSNISPEHFERYRTEEAVERQPGQPALPEQPASHHIGNTFEKVMEGGGSIISTNAFVGHSVRAIMPPQDGEENEWVEFFGNVSEEALSKYKDRVNLSRDVPPKSEMSHTHRKGYTFENCMEKGGTIVSMETQPFYAVHVKAHDGKLEYYSHVSKDTLSKYVDETAGDVVAEPMSQG